MYKQTILSLVIYIAVIPFVAESDEPEVIEVTVITGVVMQTPLTLETDPKAPRQPLPAQDGADYLKTIPGFSVIRKGGTSGDPVFRGMAGSRLSLLQDGDLVLGGCGSRMDPPTAYIFPETYDSIRLIKGPQTVLYGPGNSAGVVLFEREHQRMSETDWQFHGSILGGGFGRDDELLDIQGGTPDFYLRGVASHSQQDDYEDGDGNKVHSQYARWNNTLALGWTPSDKLTLELSGSRSDAEAAYADRGMDGSQFDRDNVSFKLIADNPGPAWTNLEIQLYHNNVDHVMDNFSLREPMGMMPMPMASNPERQTRGGRVLAVFAPTASDDVKVGLDTQRNEHSERQTMNQQMMPWQDMPRMEDAHFQQVGLFGEWARNLNTAQRVIAGLRMDDWHAQDLRETISLGMMSDMEAMPNPTAGDERNDELVSGFLRYEHVVEATTYYAGIGRNERFPDYWELISKESLDSLSAFNASSETTTQLDLGAIYNTGNLQGSVSLFYGDIDNFLLIQSGVEKPMGMMEMRSATITRNVEARTWGMEADLGYAFTDNWRTEVSLASVRGSNESDGTSLAQLSPLELRVGLHYKHTVWSGGVLWRAVAAQDRVDPGKGNIVGQDIGPSDSFNVLSVNFGWRPSEQVLLTGGVDNILDQTYAEHISRAGAMVAGFEQTTRVNEPGLTAWIKLQVSFQ